MPAKKKTPKKRTEKEILKHNKAAIQGLLGKTLEQAEKMCKGFEVRVTMLEGRGIVGDCGYYLDRINVHIKDGIIVKANIG